MRDKKSETKKAGHNKFKIMAAYLLLNRYTLTLFNLLVIFMLGIALYDLGKTLLGDMKEIDEMSKVMCGTGSTIVSYGIVLEERKSLMRIFECYPYYKNQKESAVDDICNDGGIVLLVIGLFIEVTQQFVEIPNDVINTEGKESIIFTIGCILLIITILHLLRFCYRLIRLESPQSEQSSN